MYKETCGLVNTLLGHTMKNTAIISFLPLFVAFSVYAGNTTLEAANKYVKDVNWREKSIIVGDFSCRGNNEPALIGTNNKYIVVAIFIHGFNKPPEILQYSATARDPATLILKIEDMDFEIKALAEELGYMPPGMRSSKSCKGLNLSDGAIDSAHIYWDHKSKNFADWSL